MIIPTLKALHHTTKFCKKLKANPSDLITYDAPSVNIVPLSYSTVSPMSSSNGCCERLSSYFQLMSYFQFHRQYIISRSQHNFSSLIKANCILSKSSSHFQNCWPNLSRIVGSNYFFSCNISNERQHE